MRKIKTATTGAEILLKSLSEQGVKVIFGYPGSDMLPFYDSLYRSGEIKHFLVRHEQAAAHAADGYARLTKRPGVCMSTSGPGATNLVTGIAAAFADSVPIIALTFNAPQKYLGKGVFQEVDMPTMTAKITKQSWRLRSAQDIPEIVDQAFETAMRYPRGPVLIDIPNDILRQEVRARQFSKKDFKRLETRAGYPKISNSQIRDFLTELREAQRPVFIAGSGLLQAQAHTFFRKLIKRVKIPMATTVSGTGIMPEKDPLALEVAGVLGTPYANSALQKADLIVAWGTGLELRTTGNPDYFAPKAKVIQVDIDPAQCRKFILRANCLLVELRDFLKKLLNSSQLHQIKVKSKWLYQIKQWKKACRLDYDKSRHKLRPEAVMELLEKLAPRAIIFAGNGLHKYWALRYFHYSFPGQFVANSRFGAMGFALPGAMGAKIGKPKAKIFVITGDGDFQMNLQELATISENKIALKILVFNNQSLGAIRQHQFFSYQRHYIASSFRLKINFAKLANLYGIRAETISQPSQLKPALKRLVKAKGPYLLNLLISPDIYLTPKISIKDPLDKLSCYLDSESLT